MVEKKELTVEEKDFLSKLSMGIQQGDPHWIETALEMKEKTQLYNNWLKFCDNRGYTEIFAEPQETKEKFDKLKKEIKSHKGTGIMLSTENQNLIRQKLDLEKEIVTLKAELDQARVFLQNAREDRDIVLKDRK